MRVHLLAFAGLLALSMLAAGCGDDSVDLEGFPYSVDFRIWRYDNGQAYAFACLYRYSLCEEAGTVTVEHAGTELALQRNPDFPADLYSAWFNRTVSDEPVRFTWSGAGEQSKVTGEVPLSEAYAISAPAAGSNLSAADPVTLDWTAGSPDGLMAWGYSADCPGNSWQDFSHLVPDSGHVEIPSGQLFDGCFAELALERLQSGGTSSGQARIFSSEIRFVQVTIGP